MPHHAYGPFGLMHDAMSGFPLTVLVGAIGSSIASAMMFSAAVETGSSGTLTAAIITSMLSLVSLVVGAFNSWQKNQLDRDRMEAEARDRDHQRKHEAEQAELARKERQHTFANQLQAQTLTIDEQNITIHALREELAHLKHDNAELRSTIRSHDAMITENRGSIEQVKQSLGQSGEMPAVKAEPPEDVKFDLEEGHGGLP